MWFKQIQMYQYSDTIPYDTLALEEALQAFAFSPCLPSLPSCHGWTSPINKEDAPLLHAGNGYLMICLQIEEKVLPAAVVNQELEEKIKRIKVDPDRKVSRKEKNTLKDEVIRELLPRAFSKPTRVYGYFDLKNKWLIINSTTQAKVDRFIELLKRTFDDLKLNLIQTKRTARLMTNWILDDGLPRDFSVDQSCVLRDTQQQARKIRCQHQDLGVESIESFIKDGCEVQQLALNWQDKLSFTLVENFTIRSVKYHDVVLEAAKDEMAESEEQRFDTDFLIMTETLSPMLEMLQDLCVDDETETASQAQPKVAEPA